MKVMILLFIKVESIYNVVFICLVLGENTLSTVYLKANEEKFTEISTRNKE